MINSFHAQIGEQLSVSGPPLVLYSPSGQYLPTEQSVASGSLVRPARQQRPGGHFLVLTMASSDVDELSQQCLDEHININIQNYVKLTLKVLFNKLSIIFKLSIIERSKITFYYFYFYSNYGEKQNSTFETDPIRQVSQTSWPGLEQYPTVQSYG